jgi:NAD+ synthase (glutamine-hydrolysing)
MKLVLAQINHTIGDFRGLEARVDSLLASPEAQGADLIVLPELAATGYPPRDLLEHEAFVDANLALVERLTARTAGEGPALLLGYVERNEGPGKRLHNAVALLDAGRLVARRFKSLLPTYDVFDEARYFEPARDNAPVELRGVRLGLTICEDLWFPALRAHAGGHVPLYGRDPLAPLVAGGAELLINVSASPFTLGKSQVRRDLVSSQARRLGIPVVYVNQVGAHDELIFDGCSKAVDAAGNLVARARDFEEDVLVVDFEPAAGARPPTLAGPVRDVSGSREEEAFRALVLGLRDYTRRCGFDRVVLGLSGGVDSALTAAVAARALGPDRVLGVAMPSRYSSQGSVADARQLAHNLDIGFEIVPIEPMYAASLTALAPLFGDRSPDVTEENLQARLRGLLLMALSNKLGSLLLTTGNKSELAVGYCTLYGDMCGGLAVLSDLPKTLIYRVSRWLNQHGEIIPEATLTKPPSAELRENQTDQDTLPPYDVLDALVEGYVEEQRSVGELAERGLPPELVRRWIRTINLTEYKRRQAAPGLRLTSKAFGVGRRMPIAARYDWED